MCSVFVAIQANKKHLAMNFFAICSNSCLHVLSQDPYASAQAMGNDGMLLQS